MLLGSWGHAKIYGHHKVPSELKRSCVHLGGSVENFMIDLMSDVNVGFIKESFIDRTERAHFSNSLQKISFVGKEARNDLNYWFMTYIRYQTFYTDNNASAIILLRSYVHWPRNQA